MNWVGIVITVLIIIWLIVKYKMVGHPVIIFYSIWSISLIFVMMKMYGMTDYSQLTIQIIFVGLFGFGLGVLISYLLRKIKFKLKSKRNTINKLTIHWYFAYAILILGFIGSVILFVIAVLVLRNGVSYANLRNMYYGYGNSSLLIKNGLLRTYINWISVPAIYALMPIALIMVFERQNKKVFISGVFISAFMYVFASAGRNIIVFMLVQSIILVQYYKFKVPKKFVKHIKKGVVVLAILLGIYMVLRKSTSDVHVPSIYAYFTAPILLMDYWVKNLGSHFLYLHGGAFCYGIFTLLNWMTSKMGFGFPGYSYVNSYIQATQDQWIEIFRGRWYNAFVSQFYYFYIDFGVIGVLVADVLWGMLCYRLFYLALIKQKKKYLPWYLIMVQCLVCSIIRWQLGTATMVLTIIMEFLLTFEVKRRY